MEDLLHCLRNDPSPEGVAAPSDLFACRSASSEAKVAVLDAATAKVVKVLENLGTYPHILLDVPEAEK